MFWNSLLHTYILLWTTGGVYLMAVSSLTGWTDFLCRWRHHSFWWNRWRWLLLCKFIFPCIYFCFLPHCSENNASLQVYYSKWVKFKHICANLLIELWSGGNSFQASKVPEVNALTKLEFKHVWDLRMHGVLHKKTKKYTPVYIKTLLRSISVRNNQSPSLKFCSVLR